MTAVTFVPNSPSTLTAPSPSISPSVPQPSPSPASSPLPNGALPQASAMSLTCTRKRQVGHATRRLCAAVHVGMRSSSATMHLAHTCKSDRPAT
eukprot:20604-Prorocentrum_minimum.AAC.1